MGGQQVSGRLSVLSGSQQSQGFGSTRRQFLGRSSHGVRHPDLVEESWLWSCPAEGVKYDSIGMSTCQVDHVQYRTTCRV